MAEATLPGLQIDSPLTVPSALNFRPISWPPPANFPVSIDANGNVKSRYSDPTWDLSPWAGTFCTITFEGVRKHAQFLSSHNADLLRMIAAWWLWGPAGVQKPATLESRLKQIKPLFVACSGAGIAVDQLSGFPELVAQLAKQIKPAAADACIGSLHRLWTARDRLGFVILDEPALVIFSRNLPRGHERTQTAYIPERIWSYQVLRLRTCLDDFIAHREQVERCYRFCLNEYAHNAGGSLTLAFTKKGNSWLPFAHDRTKGAVVTGARTGRRFHGPFLLTARRFGIDGLLEKWVDGRGFILDLSKYLSLVTLAGTAYCLNFSLMRRDEGTQLRSDCLRVERDELGEDIHLLGGSTTKTIEDEGAYWIVSPSVAVAVEAMRSVAYLRLEAARQDPERHLSPSDIANPLLYAIGSEPWSTKTGGDLRSTVRPYQYFVKDYPKLMDLEEVRITAEDLAVANQMTQGLDEGKYSVGKIWPLSWHQLRRTGAVNMLTSGLVSEGSLQYQLKHASRGMTRYYGQNWYKLKAKLSTDASGFFIREKFHVLASEVASLPGSAHLISPHGAARRDQLLRPISEKDFKALEGAAKNGKVSFRRTIFGGCVKPDPCPYGGLSHFTSCAGAGRDRPCEHALFDVSPGRRDQVMKLQRDIGIRLLDAEDGSPLADSLNASLEATQRYLDASTDTV